MSDLDFDREWSLAELLDSALLARIGPALSTLLGSACAILSSDGQTLWGLASPEAKRRPLTLELEPIGYLLCASANPAALDSAQQLLVALLHAQARFHMTSTLHLAVITEDFDNLKREHARLLDSEARYKKLSSELESRVKAQVKELEERQQMLYAAEKLAAVGQLAAGMAHEINNPLGFVRSNLGTLQNYLGQFAALKDAPDKTASYWQEKDLDFVLEDAAALIAESQQGIERIARIVSDLKNFSNVDRATEEFSDLNSNLQHVADIMRHQLPAGVELLLDLQPLPRLVCLPGHINQLLFNLIRNAIQAISDSGHPGHVRISSKAVAHGIEIGIADNGIGMSQTQLDHAFEPFYTTRPVGAGAGLGLTSARNIVLAHSGRIDLSSQPNSGTTITLFFPVPT